MKALTKSVIKVVIKFVSAQWLNISPREQRMVIGCSILALCGVIYWGVIQPISTYSVIAQERVKSEKQLLHWVSNTANNIVNLRGENEVAPSTQPLNQVVSSSAKKYNIELIRIQPRDDMIQVWVQPAIVFNQLIHWIAYLQEKQGIQVEFMDISNSDSKGLVEVKRLQLKRGG